MMFYKETKFKETSMGLIPSDWKAMKIGECISRIISGDWGIDVSKEGYVKCRVIRGTDFPNVEKGELDCPLRYIECKKLEETEIKPNDLLVEISGGSKDQPTGRILLLKKENIDRCNGHLFFTNFVKLLKLNTEVNPFFFYYWWLYRYFLGRTSLYEIRTTNIRNFKYKQFLLREYIFLPSHFEQRAIVGVLGVVDSAIKLVDRVIAKAERLKKGLMQMLLTRGIGHREYKQTPIGTIPKEWEISSIGEKCYVGTGGTPSRKRLEYFGGNIPWVKSTEIDYKVIAKTEEYITELGLKNSNAKIYPKGTLVIAMYGQGITRGKCAILGVDAAINQACAAITPKEKESIHTLYLYYWCQFNYKRIRNLGQGANQPNLNLSLIRSIKVAIPSFSEQKKIAEVLSAVDKKLEVEKKEKRKIERIKQGLMDLLLTGKIRVR